jgi:hypothetical protein
LKSLGTPAASPPTLHRGTDRRACRSTGPTCQPHCGRGGVDCADLAAGELAGDKVTTNGFPAKRQTQCASRRRRRSSRLSSMASKAVRRRGSPTVRRLRPWRRQARCARGPRGQGEREIKEKNGGKGKEGALATEGRARRPLSEWRQQRTHGVAEVEAKP